MKAVKLLTDEICGIIPVNLKREVIQQLEEILTEYTQTILSIQKEIVLRQMNGEDLRTML